MEPAHLPSCQGGRGCRGVARIPSTERKDGVDEPGASSDAPRRHRRRFCRGGRRRSGARPRVPALPDDHPAHRAAAEQGGVARDSSPGRHRDRHPAVSEGGPTWRHRNSRSAGGGFDRRRRCDHRGCEPGPPESRHGAAPRRRNRRQRGAHADDARGGDGRAGPRRWRRQVAAGQRQARRDPGSQP